MREEQIEWLLRGAGGRQVFATMERRAKRVQEGLTEIFAVRRQPSPPSTLPLPTSVFVLAQQEAGIVASVLQIGSFFQLFFLPELPTNYREASLDSSDKQNWLIFALTNRGVHWRNSLTNCR